MIWDLLCSMLLAWLRSDIFSQNFNKQRNGLFWQFTFFWNINFWRYKILIFFAISFNLLAIFFFQIKLSSLFFQPWTYFLNYLPTPVVFSWIDSFKALLSFCFALAVIWRARLSPVWWWWRSFGPLHPSDTRAEPPSKSIRSISPISRP